MTRQISTKSVREHAIENVQDKCGDLTITERDIWDALLNHIAAEDVAAQIIYNKTGKLPE